MWEEPGKGTKWLGYILMALPFVGIAVFAYLVVTRWL